MAIRAAILFFALVGASTCWALADELPSSGVVVCDTPLEIPDCTPTQACDTVRDDRDCNACLLRIPFGGCMLRGNDPACEVSKVALNSAYAQGKLACEASKAAQKVQCEAAKSSIIALNAERAASCGSGVKSPNIPFDGQSK
jgi:hypothetical protein